MADTKATSSSSASTRSTRSIGSLIWAATAADLGEADARRSDEREERPGCSSRGRVAGRDDEAEAKVEGPATGASEDAERRRFETRAGTGIKTSSSSSDMLRERGGRRKLPAPFPALVRWVERSLSSNGHEHVLTLPDNPSSGPAPCEAGLRAVAQALARGRQVAFLTRAGVSTGKELFHVDALSVRSTFKVSPAYWRR